MVSCIISKDENCIAFRDKIFWIKFNFSFKKFKVHKKQEEIVSKSQNTLFKHEKDDWAIIASILGCDGINHAPNVSFATEFNKALHALSEINPHELAKEICKLSKANVPSYYEERLT